MFQKKITHFLAFQENDALPVNMKCLHMTNICMKSRVWKWSDRKDYLRRFPAAFTSERAVREGQKEEKHSDG